jgi:4a-hydroxytetrahydrobiopterin dehydratase
LARNKLSEEEIGVALAGLPDWVLHDGKLHKTFKFDSFAAAIGWMVSVAIYVDKIDHHPEWRNVYNKVEVELTTHDLGNAISQWDVDLARHMNKLAK